MLAALPAALILPVVAILSFVLRWAAPGERFSSSAVFAVLASVTLFAFVAVTKPSRPRAGVLAACHALAWAPFLAVGAWQSIDAAIVSRPQMRCGTGLTGLLMVVVPVGVVLPAPGTPAGNCRNQE